MRRVMPNSTLVPQPVPELYCANKYIVFRCTKNIICNSFVLARPCSRYLLPSSDSFDLGSFFQLHDLNQDGFWDRAEIEAVYGVHHEYSKAKTPDEQAQQAKADKIVDAVLKKMDKNGNGLIEMSEFEAAGWEGLQSFKELGADGHHYDVESGTPILS